MAKRSSKRKLAPLWRWVAATVALAIGVHEIVGYTVARAINLSYFKDPAVPISVGDVATVSIGLYLLIVALSGRWLPWAKNT